ncbi:hypothetical protein JNB11_08100 [Kocuria palustris]|nr:hypothetical protein [Kocuria palustris]
MITVSITLTSTRHGVTYYTIQLKLPLRTISVDRRFQEFETLHNELCRELGINRGDFPYELPKKRLNWLHSSETLADERKPELDRWLNEVIRDGSIQNLPALEEFLRLPQNFKFEPLMFRESAHGLQVFTGDIDDLNWLDVHRQLTAAVNTALPQDVTDRMKLRSVITKTYLPLAHKLESSLERSKLKSKELERRKGLIAQTLSAIKTLSDNLTSSKPPDPHVPGAFSSLTAQTPLGGSKRVFGGGETKDTVNLSKQELLQEQIQIHQNQDQEVEQLRQIVARQRQLGVAIGNEVDEQNEMLDQFGEDIDNVTVKLDKARLRAKKIL